MAPGINLALLPIQAAKVSGLALDADGKPMIGSMVNVMQRVGAAMVGNTATMVRPDGRFTLNLTPGDYVIRTFGQTGTGTDGAIAEITVNGSDISDLQLVATKPSTIRGRIAFAESATASGPPKPTAFDLGAVREWMIGAPVRSQAKIKDDGTFEISLQPGHVLIRGAIANPPPSGPNGPSPWRLGRVIVNDLDVGDSGIDVPPNGAIENVMVEMTNRVSAVSGRVTDAEGKTVRDCYAIVFAQDPSHWTVQTRYLSASRPGTDDLFHARLLPGDYYAVAMSDVEANAWTDPEFLSLARERATRFSIGVDETKTIDLPLSAAPVF